MVNGQFGSAETTARYRTLLTEAMPSISSSAAIFANAPAGTKEIWFTVRTAPLTMRTDGSAATAGVNGQDFAVNSGTVPHVLRISQVEALLCRAIQNGGTTTGYITYRG